MSQHNLRSKKVNNITTTTDSTINTNQYQLLENLQEPGSAVTQEFFLHHLSSLKDHFSELLIAQKNDIIDKLTTENMLLKEEIQTLKEKDQEKSLKINDLERDIIDLQQYTRRNNVEICGIPNEIDQHDLEGAVIKIGDAIGVEIYEEDIEACHRLQAKDSSATQKTIVRFVNRRTCEMLHSNKFKLRDKKNTKVRNKIRDLNIRGNIYINSNLCPYFKFIWGNCKKLHNEELINRFWIYNGYVYIAVNENSEKVRINHIDKLKELFPEYEFENDLWK